MPIFSFDSFKQVDRIESNLPKDTLRIELFLSDYCNQQCWYCSDEYHSKTVRWPNLDILLPNFLHLLDYYKTHGKKKFIIHLGGGEPSMWPEVVDFVRAIKTHSSCLVSLTTNGSRTLRWWEENVKYFDHIAVSVHHEFADPVHLAHVGDTVYENKIPLWMSVLMDPNHWDKCIGIVDTLKQSKYKWAISTTQVHHHTINYTEDQRKYLDKKSHRSNNLLYDFFVMPKGPKLPKPTIFYQDKNKTVAQHWLALNGFDNFMGWKCSIGIETLFINKEGNLKGSCGNTLYEKDFYFNIYRENFIEEFNPELKPVICKTARCICQPEVNCTKENLNEIKYIKILRE